MKKVRILFPDLNGCLRGKIIPEDQYKSGDNMRMPRSILAQDIEGDETTALEEFSPSYQDRDFLLVPDESTKFTTANSNTTNIMADARNSDNTDHPVAPRTVLKDAIAKLAEQGYEMQAASELEFYLTDRNGHLMAYSELDMPYGDVNSVQALELFLDELHEAVKSIGLDVESILNEAGVGQFEVTYKPLDPLSMADKTTFFKQTVRDLARRDARY